MAKLKHLCATISFLTLFCVVRSQAYIVHYHDLEKDTSALHQLDLKVVFANKGEATSYIYKLSDMLQSKGFIASSIDSVHYDSLSARVSLFIGDQYKWARISLSPEAEQIMDAVHWPANTLSGKVNFVTFHLWQQRVLDYLEENGHPFGKTYLENISIEGDKVQATLKIEKGPIYKIDSIRVYGDAKVNNDFLQRYLEIPNKSVYNKHKLDQVNKKILELGYVQQQRPADLTLLGEGSILNLYLKAKKTSQINALVGLAPGSVDPLTGNQKLLLTIDANILLKNAFGNGETLGLVWQQLQKSSPRLDLTFERPFMFHSPFGMAFSLNMYKKDSLYLNIDMNLGTSYRIGDQQTASIFLLRKQTIVNGIDTNIVLQSRQLPQVADISSLNIGFGYNYNNTDYRYNPRKGNEFTIIASGGNKTIKQNSAIVNLKDPNDPSFKFASLYDTIKLKAYQIRIVTSASHYLRLGGQSTIKLGINTAVYQSGSYYRNELFQIGGYKLLRGFDEESQYVSQYAIGTFEYRYSLGLNSFFFGFIDGGYGKHILELVKNHNYIGTGIGLAFETKAGIINLAWAVGKRDDTQLNLRQSKVHLGFASFF